MEMQSFFQPFSYTLLSAMPNHHTTDTTSVQIPVIIQPAVSTGQTSTPSSLHCPLTPHPTRDFTMSRRDRAPIKFLQSTFAGEIFRRRSVMTTSMSRVDRSYDYAHTKKRQLYGTTSVCFATPTAPSLLLWRKIRLVYLSNPFNNSDPVQFNRILGNLMEELMTEVVSDTSKGMFAAREANLSSSSKIYGTMQCTPDISTTECNRCLQRAVVRITDYCEGKRGGRVVTPSCILRYESDPFLQLNVTAPPPLPPSPPPPLTNTTITDSKYIALQNSCLFAVYSFSIYFASLLICAGA
ncbi:hypothetical protein HHK36_005565 [Tetracentron sinense]|uniref:Gnk2-homologous domain-containing protein n=1 Tax=Tetracentron sinense TaxID=13715 RepID=A0A835DQT2_TETSI|nr:hypothetical protein HHK36_005565 [Tetracentron sinense]